MSYPHHVDTPTSEAEARQMLSSTIPERRQAARDYLWALHEQDAINPQSSAIIRNHPIHRVDTPIDQLIDLDLMRLDAGIKALAVIAAIVFFIVFI